MSHASFPAWRIALFLFIIASVLWLGGVHARAIIGNDMLKVGTLEFEEYLAPEAEREIYRLTSFLSLMIICSYLVAFVSSIVFMTKSPFSPKQHGWLMMSAILFYMFVPVELFTMYLDAKMIYLEFFTVADNEAFRELFIARIGALSGAPFIAILCYYTIIALVVFQPLKKVHLSTR
jgi:hypothetical protein